MASYNEGGPSKIRGRRAVSQPLTVVEQLAKEKERVTDRLGAT